MRAAIVVAGGRSERMGTPKGGLRLAGRNLFERAVDAAAPVAEVVVLVGRPAALEPAACWGEVRTTLEDPPFGGPVAGLAAGVAELATWRDDDEVFVLPVDVPAVTDVVGALAATEVGPDGTVVTDSDGRPQFLMGRYRLGALRRALAALDDVRDVSMRRWGASLDLAGVPMPDDVLRDVDTPEDARSLGLDPTCG